MYCMYYKNANFYKYFVRPIVSEFPFFLLFALFLLPKTVYYINTSLWDWENYPLFRYFSLAFLYSYIITLVVYYTKCKWIKFLLYFLSIIINLISFFLAFNFKSSISPATMLLVAETNYNESSEFLSQYLFSMRSLICYALVVILILIIIFSEKYYKRFKAILVKNYFFNIIISIFILTILLGGIYSFRYNVNMFKCKSTVDIDDWMVSNYCVPMDNISNLMYCCYDLKLCGNELKYALEATQNSLYNVKTDSFTNNINIIVVIGESYIKSHSFLYGYPLNTTPYLTKEKNKGNLFVFTNVVSPYNTTSKSLKNVFSCNSLSEGEKWFSKPYFPSIFKYSGYNVYFWDNQYDMNSNASYDFSLNSYLHNAYISKITYTDINKDIYKYDGELIDSFKKNIHLKSHNNLVLFHLMGQHSNAYKRYPHTEQFDHFNKDSVLSFRKEKYLTEWKLTSIAVYDNATLYNDFVINSIILMFKHTNSILVYFSDHGEEIYDVRDYSGRTHEPNPASDVLRCQYEVPFIIWCSDIFIKNNKRLVEDIKNSINKPFSIENVCHLLFKIGNIKTNNYISNRCILDNNYKYSHRIINDNIDYDEIVNSIYNQNKQ